jgi:hypothetical protein
VRCSLIHACPVLRRDSRSFFFFDFFSYSRHRGRLGDGRSAYGISILATKHKLLVSQVDCNILEYFYWSSDRNRVRRMGLYCPLVFNLFGPHVMGSFPFPCLTKIHVVGRYSSACSIRGTVGGMVLQGTGDSSLWASRPTRPPV